MEQVNPESPRQWLTVTGMVAEYPWPAATLYTWRHRGLGPPSVRAGRRVMYRRTDVERWIEEQFAAEAAARS